MHKLLESEYFVMEVLWGKSLVLGEVVDALKDKTNWSRNTVHTYLTRMEKKGLVSIDRTQEPHRYSPLLLKEVYLKNERDTLLNKVYQGAVSDLIVAFLKESKITQEEKDKLNQILDEIEV